MKKTKSKLLNEIKRIRYKNLDNYIENLRSYIQTEHFKKTTEFHKALFLLVARRLKLYKKGGKGGRSKRQ